MLRSIIFKRTLFNKYTNTPRSSYIVNKTYPQLIWNNLIPYPLKLTTVIGSGILTFINYHPKYYITLGPPILGLGYFGYIKFRKNQYNQAINKLKIDKKWKNSEIIRIEKYDESSIKNIINGIDNLYDSLRIQIIELVEERIIEYIFQNNNNNNTDDNEILEDFILENDQININISNNEIESWITSNVKIKESNELLKFIKFSVPYYDSKTIETRKRIGVLSVYLLEIPINEDNNLNYIDYKIGIEITPISWFNSKSLYISEIPGISEIMKSKLYNSK